MGNILVTGANGQIGMELRALSGQTSGHSWLFTDREELDLSQPEQIALFFDRHHIDVCVNCAAYTAVDRAESEPEPAARINAQAAGEIAEACRRQDALLIHFSSDYVYHNGLNRPLKEDDPADPQSVYAQTKLAGDLAALSANPKTIVLRTSWVYSAFGHNFVKTMLRLGREREEVRVVCDQIGAPTYARDLASVVLYLLDAENTPAGIYNYSNEGVCSWYDFARAIFEIAGIPCQVTPITTAEFPTPARRPPFSVLDKSKFKTTFHQPIPYWRDSLRECLAVLQTL